MTIATNQDSPRKSSGTAWMTSTRLVAVVFVLASVACWHAYSRDRAAIRLIARAAVGNVETPADQIVALSKWLAERPGTRSNNDSFLLGRWGATPIQVLAGGGDCADRSRLMVAMVQELGHDATAAMCFSAETGQPAHTIVEATLANGSRLVVDPIFNLVFPYDNGFHDLLALRADPSIVDRRVAQLRAQNPKVDPYYLRSPADYHSASTFNWNKNWATRLIASLGFMMVGDDWYRIYRPVVLEEPQLLAASMFAFLAFLSWLLPAFIRYSRRLAAMFRRRLASRAVHLAPTS